MNGNLKSILIIPSEFLKPTAAPSKQVNVFILLNYYML